MAAELEGCGWGEFKPRLAEALEYPECTLQVLRLSGNPIGCHGVSTLAEAAKTARDAGQLAGEGLQSLLLANCGLRPEPVMEAEQRANSRQ